ncbi:MAG TPA: glucose-6-phosphate dehydrogenase assembly protein OpcA [Chloroflexota bacterium]|nr:glucose-6-phosphate dehydrogenase assembly protein OpcA [Chloroflexota bacterium]
MTAPARLRTVGTWSGQDVDAEAVQSQLTKLWRSAGEHALQSGVPAAARTNVLTLVVYTETEAAASRVLDAVGALAEHHPSRTILVRAEPGADAPSLAAEVVTRCRIDRPQVCFEQIVLHARGSSVEQVSSAVASLLLRDLATYLWWPEDIPAHSELLHRLVALCDGVIVDSASFTTPAVALPALLALLRQQQSGAVADLQWARLSGWRDITAQFFDGPATRGYLNGITALEVSVRTGDRPGLPGAGLLYTAWLAGCLHWQLETGEFSATASTGEFTLRAGNRPVTIRLRAVSHDETAGEQISAIALRATIADKAADFAIHCAALDQVTTRVTHAGSVAVERTMRLPAPTDSTALAQLLAYFQRDPVYEASLRVLSDWLSSGTGAA